MMTPQMAPELQTIDWVNSNKPITLASLRGKVVLIEAFQMLCPGCVSHGLPQAVRASQTFSSNDLAVIGLHTVFEHHSAQGTKDALKAFMHEYRIPFPVGIDAPSKNGPSPKTMTAYRMQGTPTVILIDRQGRLRKQKFGAEQDMVLGAEISSLIAEQALTTGNTQQVGADEGCDENGCKIPGYGASFSF